MRTSPRGRSAGGHLHGVSAVAELKRVFRDFLPDRVGRISTASVPWPNCSSSSPRATAAPRAAISRRQCRGRIEAKGLLPLETEAKLHLHGVSAVAELKLVSAGRPCPAFLHLHGVSAVA